MEYISALITGLPFLISHLFITLCLLFIGITSYIFLTPIKELKLIKDGNISASISFSGALLGIGIPLASSLSVSNSILEIIIWGLTAIVLQLLCFKVTDTFLKDLSKRIEDDQLATSILLFSIKISVSLINSAAIIG
jgi:putative membrane protein|tara:strand:+ start:535 stop:945 length:411 start_codon:yes stop_codon:yes gene_type:complete